MKQKVVCCVVDTDKPTPFASKGATAKGVLAVERKRNLENNSYLSSFVGSVFCTIGQELENYIPYSIARDLADIGQQTLAILDRIVSEDQELNPDSCFWLYFDVKNGLCGDKLLSKRNSGELSEESLLWILDVFNLDEDGLRQFQI